MQEINSFALTPQEFIEHFSGLANFLQLKFDTTDKEPFIKKFEDLPDVWDSGGMAGRLAL